MVGEEPKSAPASIERHEARAVRPRCRVPPSPPTHALASAPCKHISRIGHDQAPPSSCASPRRDRGPCPSRWRASRSHAPDTLSWRSLPLCGVLRFQSNGATLAAGTPSVRFEAYEIGTEMRG